MCIFWNTYSFEWRLSCKWMNQRWRFVQYYQFEQLLFSSTLVEEGCNDGKRTIVSNKSDNINVWSVCFSSMVSIPMCLHLVCARLILPARHTSILESRRSNSTKLSLEHHQNRWCLPRTKVDNNNKCNQSLMLNIYNATPSTCVHW